MSLSRARRHGLRQLARGRGDGRAFLLEGPKLIREALEDGAVQELFLVGAPETGATAAGGDALLELATRQAVSVSWMSAADAQQIGATVSTQGALALVRDAARPLETVLRGEGLRVWLDRVQDPGNVGAIFRVAAAFGAQGLLLGPGCADPMGRKALSASAGHALRLPFARATEDELAGALSSFQVVALEAGGTSLFDTTQPAGNTVLVLGSEGQGLGPLAERLAQTRMAIPMAPGVESLNVAVSLGVALSWWWGRRSL